MYNGMIQLKKQKVVIFEKENVILRIICFVWNFIYLWISSIEIRIFCYIFRLPSIIGVKRIKMSIWSRITIDNTAHYRNRSIALSIKKIESLKVNSLTVIYRFMLWHWIYAMYKFLHILIYYIKFDA